MKYRVGLGGEYEVMAADQARAAWDATPEGQRTGKRDGAFILWSMDGLGRLTAPVIFRPVDPTRTYV